MKAVSQIKVKGLAKAIVTNFREESDLPSVETQFIEIEYSMSNY